MSDQPAATADVDLDGYFARIGYAGPRELTLEVLRRLHELHPAAIDVLLGRGIGLDPRAWRRISACPWPTSGARSCIARSWRATASKRGGGVQKFLICS